MHLTNAIKHMHVKEAAFKRIEVLEKSVDEIRAMTESVDRSISRKDAGEQEREERLRKLEERVLELEDGVRISGRSIGRPRSRGGRGGVSSSLSSSLAEPKPSSSKIASSGPPPVMIFWDSENCNLSGQEVSYLSASLFSASDVPPELISLSSSSSFTRPRSLRTLVPSSVNFARCSRPWDLSRSSDTTLGRCTLFVSFAFSCSDLVASVETEPRSVLIVFFQWDNLPTFRARIAANGVELRDCPSWMGKGTVDHTLLVEMMTAALDVPPPATFVLM